jgi:hypothetical protein
VIISDLQHIESATETEVKGGCKRPSCWHHRRPQAITAEVDPENFDTDTKTFTSTDTLTVEDQFSNFEF